VSGIYFANIFSLLAKIASIILVLSIIGGFDFKVEKFDVKIESIVVPSTKHFVVGWMRKIESIVIF